MGGQELLDQHEKLISLEKELQDKSRHESNVKETLDELRDRQRQMEPDKKRQHEREEHLVETVRRHDEETCRFCCCCCC